MREIHTLDSASLFFLLLFLPIKMGVTSLCKTKLPTKFCCALRFSYSLYHAPIPPQIPEQWPSALKSIRYTNFKSKWKQSARKSYQVKIEEIDIEFLPREIPIIWISFVSFIFREEQNMDFNYVIFLQICPKYGNYV